MGRETLTASENGLSLEALPATRSVPTERFQFFLSEAGMGAPLVLLHGLGGSSRWWYALFSALAGRAFRLIAPDLPGFGRSPGPVLSIEASARATVDLLDQLGVGRFFICGHSMGAAIAAQLAAEAGGRVRRVVLLDAAGVPVGGVDRWIARLAQPWSWCPPGFYRTLIGDLMRTGPRRLLAAVAELRRYDVRDAAARIEAPTLLVWGGKDTLTPLEHAHEILEILSDGRLEIVADSRHLPMVSHPRQTARLITEFLEEDSEESATGSGDA